MVTNEGESDSHWYFVHEEEGASGGFERENWLDRSNITYSGVSQGLKFMKFREFSNLKNIFFICVLY